MSSSHPLEPTMRVMARYVRSLKMYIADPGEDVIDGQIERLVLEKQRAQNWVYDKTMVLDRDRRRAVLALMAVYRRKPKPKKKGGRRDDPRQGYAKKHEWNHDQKLSLAKFRKVSNSSRGTIHNTSWGLAQEYLP